jgi:hypothetical protein
VLTPSIGCSWFDCKAIFEDTMTGNLTYACVVNIKNRDK